MMAGIVVDGRFPRPCVAGSRRLAPRASVHPLSMDGTRLMTPQFETPSRKNTRGAVVAFTVSTRRVNPVGAPVAVVSV